MTTHPATRQEGVMLLEVLIGMLIFSIGILALLGLQAMSIKNTIEAKYRTEASFLASEIIGLMWVNRGASNANIDNFSTAGAAPCASTPTCEAWRTRVAQILPGVTVGGTNSPTIVVANDTGVRSVTVTISWKLPDADAATRSFMMLTQINGN
jgi:type IV pilus assembly protein PilV